MGTYAIDFLTNVFIGMSLFLSTAFIYLKVTVIPVNKIYKNKLTILVGASVIAVVYACLCLVNHSAAQLTSYLFPSFFFLLFERENYKTKILIVFLSSCFTRIIVIVPMLLISAVSVILNPEDIHLFNVLIYCLNFLITFLLLQIKRFRKGFQFFNNEKNLGIGLVISGLLFVLFGIIYTYDYINDFIAYFVWFGIFISAFGIYLWIRRSITAHYREKLQFKSEERYQELLKEKEGEVERLNHSNEFLAKIVHRDNHLMSALDSSINAYSESDDKTFKENLLHEIQTLANERGELIEKEQRESKILPSTGNILIDGAISSLYIKAAAHGIGFDLTVSETVDKIIGKYISQTDLQTLICDHIKDAIIAVDAAGKKSGQILVELSEKNDNFTITVFDNGVDFDIETFAKLGTERVTTHAETGGSGIGFMTTFETLRKAHASLVITEFENKTSFSKSIALIFNGDNKFIIQSYRSDQLKAAINRDDVIIL